MKITRWLLLWGLILVGTSVFAQDLPKKPNPPRLVNDFAQKLVQSEVDELERKLVAYNDSTSTQIAIVLVKTLGDHDITEAAVTILREWGIGSKKNNNGVLILAAIDDRQIRIETGSGMEGSIPDAVAFGIINKVIKPNFRADHYYQGLDEAVDDIIAAAAGEYKGVPRSKQGPSGGNIVGVIIFILILVFIIGRGGGGGRGGGRVMSRRGDSIFGGILGGMIGSSLGGGGGFGGGGGGWSGGGGGGGFGGFGGGSGGGGGASGSW
ncbi:TPM domain-containing protein [Chitinophaga sp. SYP-B3965]|uniref:TPM domain-containing protein n=1 Tax=Chitinophaga sp. SYP-B3965 TaxID=2663120 RepID=UPI0012995989|nr:TPM domain-containing protein [Chitinophaga sp. SYP-B3965]MRG48055.1 TPM domain-containing protein [Chitinophaga sp. SYP-B3965]